MQSGNDALQVFQLVQGLPLGEVWCADMRCLVLDGVTGLDSVWVYLYTMISNICIIDAWSMMCLIQNNWNNIFPHIVPSKLTLSIVDPNHYLTQYGLGCGFPPNNIPSFHRWYSAKPAHPNVSPRLQLASLPCWPAHVRAPEVQLEANPYKITLHWRPQYICCIFETLVL